MVSPTSASASAQFLPTSYVSQAQNSNLRWRMISAAPRRSETRFAVETVPRTGLYLAQTPQVFRRAALEAALAQPEDVLKQATDDAWLLERAGGTVQVLASGEPNFKVTTEVDRRLAEALLERR